ncbi:MAG: DUF3883 domain-containing protein [Armatimonadetes bacterium]|nr:DUF3883 domain-containing protein [Armatimonadota bacterium]
MIDRSAAVKKIRRQLGLTQTKLAELLDVSFATVNRWEKGRFEVPDRYFDLLEQAEQRGALVIEAPSQPRAIERKEVVANSDLDFGGNPKSIRTLAEGERLSFGHLANPVFGTEVSLIDPLPHQRIAVYDRMLKEDRLRFLLADDAGAGKTIMSGLYIREMLARRLIRRILVVPPAGLLGNWQSEMASLFNLDFAVATGKDAKRGNSFIGDASDQLIVSMDTLRQESVLGALRDPRVEPYDLVIFDEAHKLAADKEGDVLIRRTGRYRLAEALAGVPGASESWRLTWSARHLLLLTATPHMGKDYPFYCLWRLLDPELFSTQQALDRTDRETRKHYFIRRTKEEMVDYAGKRIYPTRIANTFGFKLSPGIESEQELYDRTTDYLETFYNKADVLNASAAQFAMSVFQRRLASSTYALLCSFQRRLAKLDDIIKKVEAGDIDFLAAAKQSHLELDDPDKADVNDIDRFTADEEGDDGPDSEAKMRESEEEILARSLEDLQAERAIVDELVHLARRVYERGDGSKFEKLMGLLSGGPVSTGDDEIDFSREKVLIFTEHRDTLEFLVKRLEQHGFTGRVGFIHGGLDYEERGKVVAEFKKPLSEGGLQYLIATDAAGEGINLQFCWALVNWDVPWNPARLEQRMGRIHRYGQKHDPVYILNLIADETREGRVMKTLLDKLEIIRKQVGSDKVYDVVGRLFQGVSLRDYMREAIVDADGAVRKLGGKLTKEQVDALDAQDDALYGEGGEVARELPRLQAEKEAEIHRQLLPGYVQRFVENVCDAIDVDVEPSGSKLYRFKPRYPDALATLRPTIDRNYPESSQRRHVSFVRTGSRDESIFLHPGEPVYERIRAICAQKFQADALRGAVFLDPSADRPSLFALMRLDVNRQADESFPGLRRSAVVESHLVGIEATGPNDIEIVGPERLLLLADGSRIPPGAVGFISETQVVRDAIVAFAHDQVASNFVIDYRAKLNAAIPGRESRLRTAFDIEYLELAELRNKLKDRVLTGNVKATIQMDEVKKRQREFEERKRATLTALRREPELVQSEVPEVLAWALIVPTQSQEAQRQIDERIEQTAMRMAMAYEQAYGATTFDVSTPVRALAEGLREFPGFDLLSRYPDGSERYIEVKGRAGAGEVNVSDNEWSAACNYRENFWLYVAYDCDKSTPRLHRVNDPFASLLVRGKGVMIGRKELEKFAQE